MAGGRGEVPTCSVPRCYSGGGLGAALAAPLQGPSFQGSRASSVHPEDTPGPQGAPLALSS